MGTVFYIIYYTLLAGFWMLCLTIFFQFVDDHEPRWQQDGSLIGSSPALGVRPGQDADMIESSMIIFNKDATKDGLTVTTSSWSHTRLPRVRVLTVLVEKLTLVRENTASLIWHLWESVLRLTMVSTPTVPV